jgi:hypothetical protein
LALFCAEYEVEHLNFHIIVGEIWLEGTYPNVQEGTVEVMLAPIEDVMNI